MMMKRGSNVATSLLEIDLEGVPVTAALCATLVRELIKHLLFSREQLPCMYDALLQEVLQKGEQLRPRSGRSARRTLQAS